MNGAYRATLLRSLGHLLRNTKAAIGTNSGCFLPTEHIQERVEHIEATKGLIPRGEETADFELPEVLNEVCRNAVVLHSRIIDRKIRAPEKEESVPTTGSDALMEDLQTIFTALGDDRDLQSMLTEKRKKRVAEEEGDPNQTDLVDEAEELAGATAE